MYHVCLVLDRKRFSVSELHNLQHAQPALRKFTLHMQRQACTSRRNTATDVGHALGHTSMHTLPTVHSHFFHTNASDGTNQDEIDALRLCHEFPLNRDCFKAMLELPDIARNLEQPLWDLALQTPATPSDEAAHAHAAAASASPAQHSVENAENVQCDSDALTFSQLMVFAWRVCKADVDQRCEMFWRLFSTNNAHGKRVATLSTDEVNSSRLMTCLCSP